MTVHTDTTIARGSRSEPGRPDPAGGSSWRLPLALVLLSLVPVTAGILRIIEIVGGPQLLPDNPRVVTSPTAVVLHIVAAAGYALVGAFQFSARFRRRHPGWHRKAGRVLVGAGLVVAGSGLWLTLLYPGAPGGGWLWTVRLVVGSAMGASLVAGVTAIRRRDIAAHRAWMMRAYALGLGAGTQVITESLGAAAFGTGDMSKTVSLSAGWIINAAVAEWAIRRVASVRDPARASLPGSSSTPVTSVPARPDAAVNRPVPQPSSTGSHPSHGPSASDGASGSTEKVQHAQGGSNPRS